MKRGMHLMLLVFVILLMSSLVSAGFFDWFKKTTGEATEGPVDFNISVGTGNAPQISRINNWTGALTLNDGPSNTNITINFTVSDSDGANNIDDGSAWVNLTNSGMGRANTTDCTNFESSGNFANYSCKITLWWWDSDGTWTAEINISDNNKNNATSNNATLTLNSVTGFVSGPGNLTFTTLNPGTTNQTPSDFITLNNTGNQNVGTSDVQVNATDLKGEVTNTQGLWANNFSVGTTTGGADPECDASGGTATNMTNGTSGDSYEPIYTSVLALGNYTVNDGATGQEILYMCIQKVGLELSQQSYSTKEEGAWTIKIV